MNATETQARIATRGRNVLTIDGSGLYAVGSGVEVPNPIRWMPAGKPGWLPFQVYVFADGRESLIVDTGLAVHRRELREGLEAVLPKGQPPRVTLTRWELDASANLAWMIESFGVREIQTVGELDPLDFFTGFEYAAANTRIKEGFPSVRRLSLVPGDRITPAGFDIEVLSATLRLLLTYWFYDHRTRSLFTADSFSHLVNPHGPRPFKANEPGQITTESMVEGFMLKFQWLKGTHNAPIIEFLREQRRRPIERICPMYGGVIEGADRVEEAFDAAEEALAILADMKPKSVFEGFSLEKVAKSTGTVDVDGLARPWAPRSAGPVSTNHIDKA